MTTATIDPNEYISGGYYVSVDTHTFDSTGTRLRSSTMAFDHTSRAFFPADDWEFWTNDSAEERREFAEDCEEEAAVFGIPPEKVEAAIKWVSHSPLVYGSTCFDLKTARWLRREFLAATEVQIWEIGLHESVVEGILCKHEPPPRKPGYAPMAGGSVQIALSRRAKIEPGGVHLG